MYMWFCFRLSPPYTAAIYRLTPVQSLPILLPESSPKTANPDTENR